MDGHWHLPEPHRGRWLARLLAKECAAGIQWYRHEKNERMITQIQNNKNVAISHLLLPWSFLRLLAAERDRSHIPMGQLLSFRLPPIVSCSPAPSALALTVGDGVFPGRTLDIGFFRRRLSGRAMTKWHRARHWLTPLLSSPPIGSPFSAGVRLPSIRSPVVSTAA